MTLVTLKNCPEKSSEWVFKVEPPTIPDQPAIIVNQICHGYNMVSGAMFIPPSLVIPMGIWTPYDNEGMILPTRKITDVTRAWHDFRVRPETRQKQRAQWLRKDQGTTSNGFHLRWLRPSKRLKWDDVVLSHLPTFVAENVYNHYSAYLSYNTKIDAGNDHGCRRMLARLPRGRKGIMFPKAIQKIGWTAGGKIPTLVQGGAP